MKTIKTRDCVTRQLLLSIAILAFSISGCGPGQSAERRQLEEKANNLIGNFNEQFYSFYHEGYMALMVECESSIVTAAVVNIKDDVLRNQMNDVKNIVYWDYPSDFGIRIKDVPELPISEWNMGNMGSGLYN